MLAQRLCSRLPASALPPKPASTALAHATAHTYSPPSAATCARSRRPSAARQTAHARPTRGAWPARPPRAQWATQTTAPATTRCAGEPLAGLRRAWPASYAWAPPPTTAGPARAVTKSALTTCERGARGEHGAALQLSWARGCVGVSIWALALLTAARLPRTLRPAETSASTAASTSAPMAASAGPTPAPSPWAAAQTAPASCPTAPAWTSTTFAWPACHTRALRAPRAAAPATPPAPARPAWKAPPSPATCPTTAAWCAPRLWDAAAAASRSAPSQRAAAHSRGPNLGPPCHAACRTGTIFARWAPVSTAAAGRNGRASMAAAAAAWRQPASPSRHPVEVGGQQGARACRERQGPGVTHCSPDVNRRQAHIVMHCAEGTICSDKHPPGQSPCVNPPMVGGALPPHTDLPACRAPDWACLGNRQGAGRAGAGQGQRRR